ncbi:MAG: carboxypeptidase regulatory-like domain-containing protein [Flavobacteriales bacterium]|nr:carboxypeptidase regulatory-like domain-containing protein [Flavobacteriales bacterium]
MKTTNEQINYAGIEQLLHAISLPESKTDNNSGTFKGKVVSAKTGARVFGCVVELLGSGRTYVTSPTGYFKMTNIPEGIYMARFSFPGFKEVNEAVVVLNGESLDVTLELEVV